MGSTLARHGQMKVSRGDKEDSIRLLDLPAAETRIHTLPVDNQDIPYNCTLRVLYMPSMDNRYLDLNCQVRWEQRGMIRQVNLGDDFACPLNDYSSTQDSTCQRSGPP